VAAVPVVTLVMAVPVMLVHLTVHLDQAAAAAEVAGALAVQIVIAAAEVVLDCLDRAQAALGVFIVQGIILVQEVLVDRAVVAAKQVFLVVVETGGILGGGLVI